MLKLTSLTIIALAAAGLSTPAAAQSAGPATVCPARYELLTGNLCIQPSNGDVVFAAAPAATVYTSADCRRGYEYMIDNLCIHPKWGDVVFVNDRPTFAAASCRAGYEFLINGLCFNRASGDIVFSEVKTGTTLAAVRP